VNGAPDIPVGRCIMNRLDDPQHWWSRAEEAKALAELMQHPDSRRIMIGIAEGYEKIARHIEIRLRLIRPELQ
jgi:hypothetical protein